MHEITQQIKRIVGADAAAAVADAYEAATSLPMLDHEAQAVEFLESRAVRSLPLAVRPSLAAWAREQLQPKPATRSHRRTRELFA